MGQTRVKPTFLIIGAAKCGTTSLFDLLGKHPEIGMCAEKEPMFFSNRKVYERGWEWYESLYAHAAGKRALGEASHQYTCAQVYPQAPARIARDLPDARLIYIVRHPLVRIESEYEQVQMGWRGLPLTEEFNSVVRSRPKFIDVSSYWRQISLYREHYPDDRILVLFLEDLSRDPRGQLRRCFEFLGVDPEVRIEDAARPRNARADRGERTVPSRLVVQMRKAGIPQAVRRVTPAPLYEFARKRLDRIRRVPPRRPEWDEATRRWAIEQLLDDSLQFLRFYGKPLDFWDFRPIPPGTRVNPEYRALLERRDAAAPALSSEP